MIKRNKKIIVVDYGVGNLHSVVKAFNYFGESPIISEEAEEVSKADAIVLPGVGSFQAGMEGLKVRKLDKAIKDFAKVNKPILGICLGAQLLMSKGYEFGNFDGLDIIPGKVVKFPPLRKERVPHIGWNEIYKVKSRKLKMESWKETVLDSIKENSNVYFVHSYILQPEKKDNILSLANYGGYEFCSVIKKNNVYGCQFHPEKSGEAGLKIIENFIKII